MFNLILRPDFGRDTEANISHFPEDRGWFDIQDVPAT
jgi:hypothetical protein